jgi:hypothetical protein
MPRKDYPTPCIRFNDMPTGAKFIVELPSGCKTPCATEEEARVYAVEHRLHRKYGRVFIETAPKHFATLLVDDSQDEGDSDEGDSTAD